MTQNDRENPLRVSVLVTDPDGREVMPSDQPNKNKRGGTKRRQNSATNPEYVQMNMDRNSISAKKRLVREMTELQLYLNDKC